MDWEGVIIGGAAIVWGVVLFFARPELLGFAREGGKGLRDRRVINALVISAGVLLPAAGTAIMLAALL